MFIKSEKKAKNFRKTVFGLMSILIPLSFADGGEGEEKPEKPKTAESTASTESPKSSMKESILNYEDLIKKARKEEKDKLYPTIHKLEGDLRIMTENNNANLIKVAELEKKLADIEGNKSSNESELVTSLKSKIVELEGKIADYEKNKPDEEAIRKQLKAEYDVQLYKVQKLGEDDVKNNILPMFLDDVDGKTTEEIDAAIEKAKEKTAQVKEQLGVNKEKAEGDSGKSKPERNKRTTAVNPSDPSHNDFMGATDFDYVRNLSADSPEYAEWRRKHGLK